MSSLQTNLSRIFHPVVRLLISRGVRFPQLSDWLKEHYLFVAERYFQLEGKRVTDSRLHLLTGLQRKDIKSIRERVSQEGDVPNAGPIARIVGVWLAQHSDETGVPLPLNRLGPAPSFQAVVESISKDMHLRTVQDELIRQGLAKLTDDHIILTKQAFVPAEDDTAMLGYFGANLGDHAAAAVENILSAPEPGRHLERAVHYNHLSTNSLEELNELSRSALTDALTKINAKAAELQQRDLAAGKSSGRFRAGAFIYQEQQEDQS